MKTIKYINFICLLFCASIIVHAQTEEQILTAWEQGNYVQLLTYHATADSSLLPIIEDALSLVQPDLTRLEFDELKELRSLCVNDSLAMNLLTPVYNSKKRQIIAILYTSNSEDILSYLQKHPAHEGLLYGTLEECIYESLKSIPVSELLMLKDAFPKMQSIKTEISTRDNEIKSIVKANTSNFVENEFANLYRLQYVISRKAHAYLYARYKKICYEYAAIEDFSDDPEIMERQFAEIAKRNLSSDDLRQYLQLEVNAYCEATNLGRSAMAKTMSQKKYYPMQITMPQIKIGYISDKTILELIPQAKQEYADDRETIDNVAGVAKWFAGGLLGRLVVEGGKMFADYLVGSSLSDKIINARLAYLESCYLSLISNLERQIRIIENDIDKQAINNEQQFTKYVRGK